jgi:cytochrome oxidase assembly protein ShyY1
MQYFSSLRFRPGLTPTLATLVAVAILSSLGFWQVRRLHWKQGLVAQWNARIALPPLSLGEALAADPPGREYRRVTLRGVFDTAQTVVIAHMPRGLYEGGEILTPLRPSGGGAPVLVDRGWVPDRKVEAFLQSDHGGDEVEVTGRILELDLGAARPGARKERRRIWVHFDTVRQARVLQEQLPYRLAPFLVQRGDDGSPSEATRPPAAGSTTGATRSPGSGWRRSPWGSGSAWGCSGGGSGPRRPIAPRGRCSPAGPAPR